MSSAMATRVSAQPGLLKHLNERTVLEAIRTGAPISRAEISRRAGISKPTVSVALRSLVEDGLVREAREEPGGPRYGAIFFEPVPDAALVLGIDVGARFVRAALCDLSGRVRARQDVEPPAREATALLDVIAELRDAVVAAAGLGGEPRIDSVVVGVPGVAAAPDDPIRMAEAIAGLEGMAFGPALGERLGLAVTVENDVNLAALGEQRGGVGRGIDDFAFLSIGTGLGAGIVLRGELHRGRHGAAGELDLVRTIGVEQLDPCASALSAYAAEVVGAGVATALHPPYEARDLFAAARAGDPLGRAVVAEAAYRIALHVVPLAAVADVALVVLGGGIGANGDLLLAPIRELLAQRLPYPPRVEVSSLGEAAVLEGALAVGLRAALDSVFVNRPARAVDA
jgi:predicted NBD/HSP70 family sugar kinase